MDVKKINVNLLYSNRYIPIITCWGVWRSKELLNTVIYSTIVKGFTMSRQHDQVIAIFKEMKDPFVGWTFYPN